LLPDPAHGLARGARRDPGPVGEDDFVPPSQRELVRDAGADRTGTGYDDSSHASSSVFSLGNSGRNGRLTSSRTGTPSLPRQNFAAAWNGKRSSCAPPPPTPPTVSGRTRAPSAGKTAASPETAPAAPPSSPRRTSD